MICFVQMIERVVPQNSFILIWFACSIISAQTYHESKDLSLQKIRFDFDILGKRGFAKNRLQKYISNTTDESQKTYAYFLLGKVYDSEGQTDSAVIYYQSAISSSKLPQDAKVKIFWRLAEINPELVRPIRWSREEPFETGRFYSVLYKGKREYFFQFLPKSRTLHSNESVFGRIESNGEFSKINISLKPNEFLYDISPEFYLSGLQSSLNIGSVSNDEEEKVILERPISDAKIIQPDQRGFLITHNKKLEYFKRNELIQSYSHQGKECRFVATNYKPSATLMLCDDSLVYQINLEEPQPLQKISSISGNVYFVNANHQFAIFQYRQSFEIRSGPGFLVKRWTAASRLSDKLHLSGNRVYVHSDNGVVRCFEAASGQEKWQNDYKAKQIYPFTDQLYMLTYYNALINVGLNGDVVWRYEFGWDSETTPIVIDGYITILYNTGYKININLDLIKITRSKTKQHLKAILNNPIISIGPQESLWVDNVLKAEPGNGLAWYIKYRKAGGSSNVRSSFHALVQAARSVYTPVWKTSSVLRDLNNYLGANWLWKRAFGPRYFPTVAVSSNKLCYLENNNQTLVIVDPKKGELLDNIHIPEELDAKLCGWKGNSLLVSSSSHLFIVPTEKAARRTRSIPLKSPICDTHIKFDALFLSDWFGRLSRYDFNTIGDMTVSWNKQIATNGLLISSLLDSAYLHAVDIKGHYYRLDIRTGETKFQAPLIPGTITGIHSQQGRVICGYESGVVVCVNVNTGSIEWKKEFPNQIFSIDGNQNNTLVITTASKKLITLKTTTGERTSEISVSIPLINKPIVHKNSYWIGTVEPALENRTLTHKLIKKYKLTDIPGNPVLSDGQVYVSTIDGFIFCFPQ